MNKRAISQALLVLLIAGISFAVYLVSYEHFERLETQKSDERLSLYQAGLRSTLERASHLPRVVALHPGTEDVLGDGTGVNQFNTFLKSVSDRAGAAALYLLDAEGTTIAASNHDQDQSFVGKNYKFRRYFTDALKTGQGTFFAVGVTTGRPGYFFSEAIRNEKGNLGVAVVKVEFDELLKDWQDAGEDVLITDSDGVVVLASNASRLYKFVQTLPENRLKELQASRKFTGFNLQPLEFASKGEEFNGRVSLEDQNYAISSADTAEIGWRIHFLTPLDKVHASAITAAVFAFLTCGLAVILLLYLRSRMERTRLAIIASEAERVRKANIRLEEEIAERKRTERQLRETQAELIQSSRLAALGKMSAAIVHEVNQPVSAIRTYTSSGKLLLEKNRKRDAGEVFEQISTMTKRLAAITSDLLLFSRKPVARPTAIDLNQVIKAMAKERLVGEEREGLSVKLDLWDKPLLVSGSEHRFQQLIGNLLHNAIQATADVAKAEILVTSLKMPQSVQVMVADNGHGIAEEVMDQLFDPFFTTKGVGKGVGLGLALSYAIVDEAGGRIRCENREDGGARFIVELPTQKAELVAGREEISHE